MTIHLPEAEFEQIEAEPTELDDAWKPAAIVIGCIVAASIVCGRYAPALLIQAAGEC